MCEWRKFCKLLSVSLTFYSDSRIYTDTNHHSHCRTMTSVTSCFSKSAQPSRRCCQHNKRDEDEMFARWQRDRRVRRRLDKGAFVINAIKETSTHRITLRRVHRGEFSPRVCLIVQFIRLATWSVGGNLVTVQQKAKLRGVRGCLYREADRLTDTVPMENSILSISALSPWQESFLWMQPSLPSFLSVKATQIHFYCFRYSAQGETPSALTY